MKRSPIAISLAVVALVLFVNGCDNSTNTPDPSTSAGSQQVDDQVNTVPPDTDVSVQIASWAEVQQMVADHKGRVVVVDIWSTSCIPCMREFPNLVKLHQDHGEDVACISVDVDYYGAGDSPDDYREPVLKLLTKWDATFQNVISSDADEALYEKLGGQLSVPIILVYGRDGELAKRFENGGNDYGEDGFTYDDHVIPLVQELIAVAAPE